MTTYNVLYNKTESKALVTIKSSAVQDYVSIGSFNHPDENDNLQYSGNHVIFHHVRDLLYKRSAVDPTEPAKFPNNITDMSSIVIEIEGVILVTNLSITPSTIEIAESATEQLTVTPYPSDATDPTVEYESEDEAIATVSESGLVEGVLAGTTNIIVTATGSGFSKKVPVTVTE